MNPMELQALRKMYALRQSDMADHLGLSERAYQEIEKGNSPLRQIHVLAIERVLIKLAALKGSTKLAITGDLKSDVLTVAEDLTSYREAVERIVEDVLARRSPNVRLPTQTEAGQIRRAKLDQAMDRIYNSAKNRSEDE